jgi:hypothetical protein
VTVPDVYVKTLVRAAALVGGEAELAMRLTVPRNELHLWISGANKPPVEVFLMAVDIVMEHDQHKTAPWLPPRAKVKTPNQAA